MTPHLKPQTLTDYLHGELSPAQDALAYAHVQECVDCRAELQAERVLTEMLRGAAMREELEFPSNVKAIVWQTIRDAAPTPLERLRIFLRPMIAVPLASVLVLGALFAGPIAHLVSAPLPTIDANFYFDEHAAQQAQSPLAERSTTPQTLEASYDANASDIPDVAAHEAVATTGSFDVEH
ncbi:MAG TPA: zf-HC2 domain-containing protein [Candidatus Baltobacteraceae bacterium]